MTVLSTFEDSAVYEYCELLFQEYERNDNGYYPSKHDDAVFQKAALNFGIPVEEVKEIYSAHSKISADIEIKRINKLPPALRKKAMMKRAQDIMRNNRDLPFHITEGSPKKPLPLSIDVLESEYKDLLTKLAFYGWTIPLIMGIQKFSEMLPIIDDEESIESYFIGFYKPNTFNKMCSRIAGSLQNPAHVQGFSECITAYKEGMFTICLPELTTILEGILAAYGDDPNNPRMMRICQYHLDKSIKKNQKIKALSWLSMNEFIRMFYEKSDFDTTEPDKRNRHWLVHGRTSKIGEQVDCLKLFNAISTLNAIQTFEAKVK